MRVDCAGNDALGTRVSKGMTSLLIRRGPWNANAAEASRVAGPGLPAKPEILYDEIRPRSECGDGSPGDRYPHRRGAITFAPFVGGVTVESD